MQYHVKLMQKLYSGIMMNCYGFKGVLLCVVLGGCIACGDAQHILTKKEEYVKSPITQGGNLTYSQFWNKLTSNANHIEMVRIAEFPDEISTILPITYYDLQGPFMSESTKVKIVKDKAKIKKLFDVLALLQGYKQSRTVTKRPEGNILLTFLLNDGSQIIVKSV